MSVAGIEHQADHALFVRKRRRQRHVGAIGQRPLEQFEHQRALRRDFRRQSAGLGEDVLLRHHLVGKPNGNRVRGGYLLAREHDLFGAARRHLADDALRAAGAGKQAERDLRQSQARIVGKDTDVGRENELGFRRRARNR